MNTLENNEILKGLLNENKSQKEQEELIQSLGGKTFDLKKFYDYVSKKFSRVRKYNDDAEKLEIKDDFNLMHHKLYAGEDKIPESFVKKVLKDLTQYLCEKGIVLREPFTQDIPYFRSSYLDKEYYLKGINDRSLPVKEYEKIQDQIEKYGSILARSNRRNWQFGGGDGDVILSLTTGKLYDVEGSGAEKLKEDYNSKQYYSSWSGLSGAGNFMAGKGSLIYMPTSRMDITYPKLYFHDVNGLNMTMCTARGVVDESLPTIIKSGKVNLGVDAVLLSQKNHLEQGTARDLINTIETRGENLRDRLIYTYKIKYFDENLKEKEKSFTYKTNMNPKDINFKTIGREVFGIERGFEVEDTGSFIDKMVGIKKYRGKYVRLGQFGLVKEVFDEHPDSNMDNLYYDDIEIGPKNEIVHKKVEVEPINSDYYTVRKFNGWVISDNLAYKNMKNSYRPHQLDDDMEHTGYHIRNGRELYAYNLADVCPEHKMEYDRMLLNDDLYHLVYEDDISRYNEVLGMGGEMNMEYEYYVPRTIFEQFSIDYWKKFLSKKLKEKIVKGINIKLLSEETQKNIARNYLKSHQNIIFTLEDSYDSGNCLPGTERFVEAFKLSDRISGKDLLKHKDFEKMLSIYDFRKIFVRKALTN